jgi:tRNA-specific 2-thiouridylase
MNEITAVAISGGVDSLMAAHLLKKDGHDVFGIHFLTGYEKSRISAAPDAGADRHRIGRIAEQLGIELHIVDLQESFHEQVVDYFTRTYRAGRTPNPCLVCNRTIKFGRVLQEALRLGASRLATGHYAKIHRDADGGIHLHRGVDPWKEQSYFLAFLQREQLARACFPLGDMTKAQTVRLAQAAGLEPVTESESQDICFIPHETYGAFLTAQPGFPEKPGPIVISSGQEIGRHNGLYHFTIGQRKGINCPAKAPYYVLRIDVAENRLVVGFKDETYSAGCRVHDINWIEPPPAGTEPTHTRIRYRHPAVLSRVTPVGENRAEVFFDEPQSSVAPGQAAVFYREDRVIGGGWIESALGGGQSLGVKPLWVPE